MKFSTKEFVYGNLYLFICYTKITIFFRKVRHVLPRLDVCSSLIANYLHIDIPDQNLKKLWIFCVLLLYVPCSCEVFPPVVMCCLSPVTCHMICVTANSHSQRQQPQPQPRSFPLLTPPLCTAEWFAKIKECLDGHKGKWSGYYLHIKKNCFIL